jgi:hypothetical protein
MSRFGPRTLKGPRRNVLARLTVMGLGPLFKVCQLFSIVICYADVRPQRPSHILTMYRSSDFSNTKELISKKVREESNELETLKFLNPTQQLV